MHVFKYGKKGAIVRSIMLVSCFIWSSVLESSGVLLSHPITSLAYHIITKLILPSLTHKYINLLQEQAKQHEEENRSLRSERENQTINTNNANNANNKNTDESEREREIECEHLRQELAQAKEDGLMHQTQKRALTHSLQALEEKQGQIQQTHTKEMSDMKETMTEEFDSKIKGMAAEVQVCVYVKSIFIYFFSSPLASIFNLQYSIFTRDNHNYHYTITGQLLDHYWTITTTIIPLSDLTTPLSLLSLSQSSLL